MCVYVGIRDANVTLDRENSRGGGLILDWREKDSRGIRETIGIENRPSDPAILTITWS